MAIIKCSECRFLHHRRMATNKQEEGDKTIFTFGDAKIELASVRDVCDGPSSLSTSVWAASILLCHHLVKIKDSLVGKRVLEVLSSYRDIS